MACAFPVANKYSEDYYETLAQKRDNCIQKIDETLKYLNNQDYIDKSLCGAHVEENLQRIGDLFNKLSNKVAVIAVEKLSTQNCYPWCPCIHKQCITHSILG